METPILRAASLTDKPDRVRRASKSFEIALSSQTTGVREEVERKEGIEAEDDGKGTAGPASSSGDESAGEVIEAPGGPRG